MSAKKLRPILLAHYKDVEPPFSTRIRGELSGDIKMTEEEEDDVAAALLVFFRARAPEQASIIGKSNLVDAQESFTFVEEERRRLVEAEEPLPSRREEALVTGAVLSRRLLGRVTGIVTLETQAPAESSKLTEAEVLLGVEPTVTGGDPGEDTTATKAWISQGDSRVRTPPDSQFDHLRADSDEVVADQPFTVSGEKLMYPGDTSLGASTGNIAGCRCSAVYNVAGIRSARRSAL